MPFSPFCWEGWWDRIVLGICFCIADGLGYADWALWAWLCFSLCLVLSGLQYLEKAVHMERLAVNLEAAYSLSVWWCTWTRNPFVLCGGHVVCTSSPAGEGSSEPELVWGSCLRMQLFVQISKVTETKKNFLTKAGYKVQKPFSSLYFYRWMLSVSASVTWWQTTPWIFCVCAFFFNVITSQKL